ncbi:ParB-like nuclease domain protein [Arthrobacter phage Altadena]|uniref:ParB-like nuclease domain protein n=1 Tax=Arthrobacter phage Altadena TaxID=3059064 RepID=A0AA96HVD6_9CAUD|nr:ParB-like nuclease domain protein [Arthrobacter phage Altadena]
MTAAAALRHRGETVRRPLSGLTQFPGNARQGDVEAIRKSLRKFGQFAPIVVQASTDYIIAGNHTAQGAELEGWTEIDAYVIEVSDEEALAINVAANKLPELGGFDPEALLRQLEEIRDIDEELLIATGISDDELEDMIVALEPDAEILPPAPSRAEEAAAARPAAPAASEDVDDAYGAPTAERASDRREKFDPNGERRNAARRLMVLDLPVEVFLWTSERLEELCEANDVQTNTEMILSLIAEASGTEAPALTEEAGE